MRGIANPTPENSTASATTAMNPNGKTEIPTSVHGINKNALCANAISTVKRITEQGYDAYLVGGCIRDLLLGKTPKDFDIATNAKPEDIRKIFKRSRIIGRRFQIVHVYFGRDVIEVTTFRGNHKPKTTAKTTNKVQQTDSARSKDGLLLRDNVYGNMEEDAWRRDFSANALYYDVNRDVVIDYCDGWSAIKQKQLIILGDAELRLREDPVRMLRAVRFAATLDFEIESQVAMLIPPLAKLLQDISNARLFEESLKLFLSGYSVKTFKLLDEYSLLAQLLPATAEALATNDTAIVKLIEQSLHNTDSRISIGKHVTPAFIFAVLLWPSLLSAMQKYKNEGVAEYPAMQQASQDTLHRQQQRTSIPKRFSQPIKEIWQLQWQLPRRSEWRVAKIMESRRFRAGYDFLLLRAECGDDTALCELAAWWTQYQSSNTDQKQELLKNAPKPPGGRRKKRPKP